MIGEPEVAVFGRAGDKVGNGGGGGEGGPGFQR